MYIYGPVPSRRLGRSLGVSLIPPKTCSYNCIYCQLGRTTHPQIERMSFFPKEDIFQEILNSKYLESADVITFVGDGEPTLNKDLGWVINKCKEQLHLPIAVITNGSLLYLKEVREALTNADIVIPSMDAGNKKTFIRMNRPYPKLEFEKIIQGQIDFRNEYNGKFWLEVMLVNNVNDSKEELASIKEFVDKINPDRVYIMTPVRPPAESWVQSSNPENIIEAQKIIGKGIAVDGLEAGNFDVDDFKNVKDAILEIGSRHPLRIGQALTIEKKYLSTGVVKQMLENNELVEVTYNKEIFLLPAHFVSGG
ncbi:MAG: radical SAM protein [Candidatus Zixiibacteriota bacterium]|nr:MAG: radical SAM protein [candidate division Zixibacteria bacterium]